VLANIRGLKSYWVGSTDQALLNASLKKSIETKEYQ